MNTEHVTNSCSVYVFVIQWIINELVGGLMSLQTLRNLLSPVTNLLHVEHAIKSVALKPLRNILSSRYLLRRQQTETFGI